MKKSYLITFLFTQLVSCNQNDNNTGGSNSIAPHEKRQIMNIAINYTNDKFENAKKKVSEDGTINISKNQIKYIINPANIVTGLIDDDGDKDAIITISSYNGQFLSKIEHLILIRTKRKFKAPKVIEIDMKIIGIKDRKIFAEISKVAPDSPNYDCSICKEVIKYKYKNGDLILME